MPEVSGTQFLKSAKDAEPEPESYKLGDDQNRYIELTLEPVERQELFDELGRLPDEFIEVIVMGGEEADEPLNDVEDPDDIDMDVDGADILTNLDGTVIDVFEVLFTKSANHPDLTSIDMENLAEEIAFEALFDVGGRVIDMSLEQSGSIKSFQEPDSDKSS